RIVQVINIDAFDVEVAQAAVKLIQKILRCHAVTSADDIRGGREARLEEGLFDIASCILRRRAVIGYKTALGGDHDFIPAVTFGGNFLERGANGPLPSLQAIVDGAVDDVAAGFDSADNRLVIRLVRRIVIISQVSPDADGRHPQALSVTKVFQRNLTVEAFPITSGAFR